MIQMRRTAAPAILARKAASWLQALQRVTSPVDRQRAMNKYRHTKIREALVRLFHGKCAYCESHITHVDYGHIEHYRPKSGPQGHPNLCFAWENLLLACGICNGGEFKADHFPEQADGGPIIHPCEDDPSLHFNFQFDISLGLASVYGTTTRGRTTEGLLGLNRPDLRHYRSQQIKKLAVLKQFAESNDEAKRLFDEAIRPDSEYSAFAQTLAHNQ
jgi:uncharacterized protein (TIGR02646 family)